MNETSSSLYFQVTDVWIVVAVLCGLLLAMSLRSYGRLPSAASGSRRLLLQCLRIGSVAVVLFLLADPHRIRRETFDEPQEIAVLVDASRSMTFQDTPGESSRWEAAREFIRTRIAPEPFSQHCRYYTFGDVLEPVDTLDGIEPAAEHSRFATAVEQVLNQNRDVPLGGVLVLTDGRFQDPAACEKVSQKLRRAGIPLVAFEFGTPAEDPDIRITSARGYQIIPFDPRLRLDLTVASPGFAGKETAVSIRREGRLLYERKVRLTGGLQELTIDFDSPFEGFQEYTVQLSEQPGERLATNNVHRFGAELRDEKIRVIYMEGTPNATEALENALEDDPQIEVTSLYFPQHSAIETAKKAPYRTDRRGRRIYNVAHPHRGFPTNLAELLQYDVVINSDIYRQAFTPLQLSNTVALVERFGGGFVMVGGQTAFGAGKYDKTVIDKLMPVDVYGNTDSEWSQFRLAFPEDALEHPIMKVGATPEETRLAWTQRFPGFGGLNHANRLKPGAVSLALHASKGNKYGPLVVFAVQQIGRGRTMAFTSDTTQGWGASFESRFGTETDRIAYYRQFWNNAVRWLAADRIQRKAGELKIDLSSPRITIGDELDIDVRLASGEADADVRLKVIQPDATELTLPMEVDAIADRRTTVFAPTQLGPHQVVAQRVHAELPPVTTRQFIEVMPNHRERATTRTNPELLNSLATRANGFHAAGPDAGMDASLLGELSVEFIEYRESSIWDRWWYLSLLAILLGSEWFLRRRWGLA